MGPSAERAPEERVGTERINAVAYGYKQAGALLAAVELRLFTHISEGAHTLPEIGCAIGLSPLNTERLVVACSAIGLLEKREGKYYNAPDVERFLVEGRPRYYGHWTLAAKRGFEQWRDLVDVLKSDKEPTVLGVYEVKDDEATAASTRSLYNVGLGTGHRLAKHYDFSKHSLLLDLGAGPGAYCIAAVQRNPNLRAIAFDFPAVCKVAEEFIARAGLSDKITTCPGDFTSDDFPEGADVILLAGNLPQYGAEQIREIARKAYGVLPPGGVMHIVSEILNDEKTGPLIAALWGLHEAIFGSYGRAHSGAEVAGYMTTAGFTDIEVSDFVPQVFTRVTGTKPG